MMRGCSVRTASKLARITLERCNARPRQTTYRTRAAPLLAIRTVTFALESRGRLVGAVADRGESGIPYDPIDMTEQVWVECVGDLIVARMRGAVSAEVLRECQEQVVALARESEIQRVLYDALEMDPPAVELTFEQRKLDAALGGQRLRRAIVVPNSRLAYLARPAFGEGEYRVFYNDMVAAVKWLSSDSSAV